MKEINLFPKTGKFAGNKDVAREIRLNEIIPSIKKIDQLILNFAGIEETTQSFIHALISDVIRKEGSSVLDKIFFKNCNAKIQNIISIVTEYMQEPR